MASAVEVAWEHVLRKSAQLGSKASLPRLYDLLAGESKFKSARMRNMRRKNED